MVVVPGKIITGICFPEYNVANACPHVTLLTNEWAPKDSNKVLENTCYGEKKPFARVYEELKERGKAIEEMMKGPILEGKVKINKDEQSSFCYFVTLANPMDIDGVTMKYFK